MRRAEAITLLDSVCVTADSVQAWMANPAVMQHQSAVTAGMSRLSRLYGGRLTPGGRHALDAAREAAGAPNVPTGTHHLLLGILDEGKGLGAKVLGSHGVDKKAVEAKIAEL